MKRQTTHRETQSYAFVFAFVLGVLSCGAVFGAVLADDWTWIAVWAYNAVSVPFYGLVVWARLAPAGATG